MIARASVITIIAVAVAMGGLSGCQKYRVETVQRPEFFQKAAEYKLPDQVVLDDGTVVRYTSIRQESSFGRKDEDAGKPFQIREEKEDGEIVLHNKLPEHVLVNALNCVRNQEYQLLWDQLLSEYTKLNYEKEGQGFDQFSAFFAKERHEIAGTLTRMVAGLPHQEVRFDEIGNGVTRCVLRPQVAGPFKYKNVFVMDEGGVLKLGMIR